mmetsp:Transcript_41302/g.106876  ORF Transcript_41302/g.106876 Transcript_41302/m.106876 type:complete len:197 (-) Transcript_41302:4232-4822(-)
MDGTPDTVLLWISQKSQDIDGKLKDDHDSDDSYKLLLLGAGESGKSTFFKQMKILHKDGFSEEERLSYKEVIHSNTVLNMKTLINGAETLEKDLEEEVKVCETSKSVVGWKWNVDSIACRSLPILYLRKRLVLDTSSPPKSQSISRNCGLAVPFRLPLPRGASCSSVTRLTTFSMKLTGPLRLTTSPLRRMCFVSV